MDSLPGAVEGRRRGREARAVAEEVEVGDSCGRGRSPNSGHETIPDSCRIVVVAGKLGEERAVFEGGAHDMECDASHDWDEANPGTEEEGDGSEEPNHPDVPRVSNTRVLGRDLEQHCACPALWQACP